MTVDRDELKRLTETPVKDMSEIEVRRLKLEAKNALAEVERLQAERDKLRTALERVITYTYYNYNDGGMPALLAHELRQIAQGALEGSDR